ncbi:uncharacterized protein LOC113291646 [Papaver somniferum]|uniref:uncharacterized protein LOC113291646 n=1 Tax=Papaver somniferum TaxID=3469 RepID=UPI000E6FF2B1|nr:uncharacterized protein LOC113291646 [Papaver somniferum]
MMWKIIDSEEDWALFIKPKYKNKQGQWNTNWQLSSVCPGLKWAWSMLKEDIRWCIGSGEKLSVWFDTWIGDNPLIDMVGNSAYVSENEKMKISDILTNGIWNIPFELNQIIHHMKLPDVGKGEDNLIWSGELKGNFSIPATVNKIRIKMPTLQWPRYIWNSFLHPSIACNVWKLVHGVYMDDALMVSKGYEMASKCCVCENDQDRMIHLLRQCKKKHQYLEMELCNISSCSVNLLMKSGDALSIKVH